MTENGMSRDFRQCLIKVTGLRFLGSLRILVPITGLENAEKSDPSRDYY